MAEKVNCLGCVGLLLGLEKAWIEGSRASLGKCIKKDFQIRKTERHCKEYSPINLAVIQHYLDYQRRKLIHTGKTLDLIEEHVSLDTHEKRSTK